MCMEIAFVWDIFSALAKHAQNHDYQNTNTAQCEATTLRPSVKIKNSGRRQVVLS